MPEAYIPILRPRRNERQVIQSFGGFSRFQATEDAHSLRPLVEVGSDDDLNRLAPFKDAGDEVLVDLPGYLTERETKYTEAINETIEDYGSREEFFRSNSSDIDIPVISTYAESPVQYGIHKSMHLALQGTFPKLTHRLMVRASNSGFTQNQQTTLKEVADLVRPESDTLLFDIVDVGYQEDGTLDKNLQFLMETFSQIKTGILNVFDAPEGQPRNITPELADRFGCESFGDFAIDRRYPPKNGGPPPRVYLRHYYPNHAYVEEFEGSDYDEAANELVRWSDYETDHCNYCRRASSAVEQGQTGNANLWKRIRMGHYIESVLKGQI